MAGRSTGNDAETSSESSFAVQSLSVNHSRQHLEQWTLPKEWNMEHREGFGTWKRDVQHQVESLESKLMQSFGQFPPEALAEDECDQYKKKSRRPPSENMFHGPRHGKPGPF